MMLPPDENVENAPSVKSEKTSVEEGAPNEMEETLAAEVAAEKTKIKEVKPIGPRWSFKCLICQVEVLQVDHYVDHQKGKKHATKAGHSGFGGQDAAHCIQGRFECYSCDVYGHNFSAFMRHWNSPEHAEAISNLNEEARQRNKDKKLTEHARLVRPLETEMQDRLVLCNDVKSAMKSKTEYMQRKRENCTETVGYCEICNVFWMHAQQRADHLQGRRHQQRFQTLQENFKRFSEYLQKRLSRVNKLRAPESPEVDLLRPSAVGKNHSGMRSFGVKRGRGRGRRGMSGTGFLGRGRGRGRGSFGVSRGRGFRGRGAGFRGRGRSFRGHGTSFRSRGTNSLGSGASRGYSRGGRGRSFRGRGRYNQNAFPGW